LYGKVDGRAGKVIRIRSKIAATALSLGKWKWKWKWKWKFMAAHYKGYTIRKNTTKAKISLSEIKVDGQSITVN